VAVRLTTRTTALGPARSLAGSPQSASYSPIRRSRRRRRRTLLGCR